MTDTCWGVYETDYLLDQRFRSSWRASLPSCLDRTRRSCTTSIQSVVVEGVPALSSIGHGGPSLRPSNPIVVEGAGAPSTIRIVAYEAAAFETRCMTIWKVRWKWAGLMYGSSWVGQPVQ